MRQWQHKMVGPEKECGRFEMARKVSKAVNEFGINIVFDRDCECCIRARKVFLSEVEEGYIGLSINKIVEWWLTTEYLDSWVIY